MDNLSDIRTRCPAEVPAEQKRDIMRSVVLFDIDGTIVTRTSGEPSSKQAAFAAAAEEIFGIPGLNYMSHPIFGLTDRGILYFLMRKHGFDDDRIAGRESEFRSRLLEIRRKALAGREQQFMALPGAARLLRWLQDHGIATGLATGNFQELARFKLQEAGLIDFFSFGGFGEDGIERTDIVRAAVSRSPARHPDSVGLIGDTPNDLNAARETGIAGFAVATGMFSAEELVRHGGQPESVFHDLLDPQAVGMCLAGCDEPGTVDHQS